MPHSPSYRPRGDRGGRGGRGRRGVGRRARHGARRAAARRSRRRRARARSRGARGKRRRAAAEPPAAPAPPSRGLLCSTFLRDGRSRARSAAADAASSGERFGGFNLLVGDVAPRARRRRSCGTRRTVPGAGRARRGGSLRRLRHEQRAARHAVAEERRRPPRVRGRAARSRPGRRPARRARRGRAPRARAARRRARRRHAARERDGHRACPTRSSARSPRCASRPRCRCSAPRESAPTTESAPTSRSTARARRRCYCCGATGARPSRARPRRYHNGMDDSRARVRNGRELQIKIPIGMSRQIHPSLGFWNAVRGAAAAALREASAFPGRARFFVRSRCASLKKAGDGVGGVAQDVDAAAHRRRDERIVLGLVRETRDEHERQRGALTEPLPRAGRAAADERHENAAGRCPQAAPSSARRAAAAAAAPTAAPVRSSPSRRASRP